MEVEEDTEDIGMEYLIHPGAEEQPSKVRLGFVTPSCSDSEIIRIVMTFRNL